MHHRSEKLGWRNNFLLHGVKKKKNSLKQMLYTSIWCFFFFASRTTIILNFGGHQSTRLRPSPIDRHDQGELVVRSSSTPLAPPFHFQLPSRQELLCAAVEARRQSPSSDKYVVLLPLFGTLRNPRTTPRPRSISFVDTCSTESGSSVDVILEPCPKMHHLEKQKKKRLCIITAVANLF
jgi:hypothetical protein